VKGIMEKREDRRDRTIRKGDRRRKDHLRRSHPSGAIDCMCEHSAWRFAKRKGLGCEVCRGRVHGNPKLGRGVCCGDGWRPAVVVRIASKRLARAWLLSIDRENEDL
jgi:hypothetical protein